MLKVSLITLFPDMLSALGHGIVARAQQLGLLKVKAINPRDFTDDPHRTVDDRSYGGGPGMVMKYTPAKQAIAAAKAQLGAQTPVIHLSPQGKPLTQADLEQLSQLPALILICSRYEGMDERVIEHHVDHEYSIGDYIVSGGELPAFILIDGITRLLPGALNHEDSAKQDSFSSGLLDHSHYTRPEIVDGWAVPKVLLSGDHAAIARWRLKEALGRTWQKRPDLLKRRTLDLQEQQLLHEYQIEHSEPDGEETQ